MAELPARVAGTRGYPPSLERAHALREAANASLATARSAARRGDRTAAAYWRRDATQLQAEARAEVALVLDVGRAA